MVKSAERHVQGDGLLFSFTKTVFVFSALLFCQNALGQSVTHIVAEGNLASQRKSPLTSMSEASNYDTPVDFMNLAAKKTQEGDYKEAAMALLVGEAYGHYDTLRVSDKTAHQGIKVLAIEKMGQVTMEQAKSLQFAIVEVAGEDGKGAIEILTNFGRRAYYPRYLIQHGMGALTRQGEGGGGIVAGFVEEDAWNTVLKSIQTK